MRFFMSVYPGDACFHRVLNPERFNYGYLFSVAYFTGRKVQKYIKGFAGEVFLDSGGFKERNNERPSKTQNEVFISQLRIAKKCKKCIIAHYDFPLKLGLTKKEMDKRISITIQHAEEFKDLFLKYTGEVSALSLGSIQGYDEKSLAYCIHRLKDIDFSLYGIGGLAKLVQTATGRWESALSRIRFVLRELKGEPLHIFGVNNFKILRALSKTKIYSIDSSSPTKGAFNSRLFVNGTQKDLRKMNLRNWKCKCPACQKFGDMVLKRGKKIFNNKRAIHNLHDLLVTLGLVNEDL